jgi:putative intracellular protease/amidase
MRKRLHRAAGVAARVAVCAVLVYCGPKVAPQASAPAPGAPPQVASATKRYLCKPCGSPCDNVVYDHPGTCPVCGMPLVEEASVKAAPAEPPHGKVAMLVFDDVEIIDFTGPWEVFGTSGFDVYTVAKSKAPVTTSMGLVVVPGYTFADAPAPDVLLVPGGGVEGARHDAATLDWVKQTSAHAGETLSVCNGAFILASAGLLDGLTATTTYHLIPALAANFPGTKVVSDRRFVDNGKIVTAAGLSSGIDGALHVVDKLRGRGAAQSAALALEYDWHPDGAFVRARLADHLIPDVALDSAGAFTVDHTEGTTDHWDIQVHGTSTKSAADLMALIDGTFSKKWKNVAATPGAIEYRFADEAGAPWTGKLTIEGSTGSFVVKVIVARSPT